jgi:hypothetical protein
VRKRAYEMWEQEGRPPGREYDHWDKASELVAIEDNQKLATIPVGKSGNVGPTGEPVEPIEATEALGDLPTLADQGEEQTAPKRRKPAATAAAPMPNIKKSPRTRASGKAGRASKGT